MVTDQGKSISLLYVEDEPDTRAILSKVIGCRYPEVGIYGASDGEAGVVTFKQHLPEIVITDINMPVADGFWMVKEIKSLRPQTEIIALTAYANKRHLLKAIELGVSHYILKPVDLEQVFLALDKALEMIRAEREIVRQNDLVRCLNADLAQKAADLEMTNHELETFNYTVAHDLRSPMVAISGYSQLLLELHASELNDDEKKYLRIINSEILNMKNLVSTLLNFSASAQKCVEKKWSDLSGMARGIRDNLLMLNPDCRVTFRIAEGVCGFCNPELLHIVLENLLGNALKYSRDKQDARIEFGTVSKEKNLIYFVRDNGVGFDQQDAEKLFTPFQRLENNNDIDGFGIGLATAFRIIQRHGGTIWAEGKKGNGATFWFTL